MLGVAIVGCGLIGAKRARSLKQCQLVVTADPNLTRAKQLASAYPGCEAVADWREAVQRDDVQIVIVATTNDSLAPVSLAAVQAGKHVLVEKPAGRNTAELAAVLEAARESGSVVKVGFNHRFHPAFLQARELFDLGAVGPLLYIRARYGHGGRLGYESEWRANPAISGGGELLDQGVHLIDLTRWFGGEVQSVAGSIHTYFWKMPVEDNGFLHLRLNDGAIAWLHASCTEWKNLFSFEIFGRNGKLQIDGLGGSYGTERLTYYRMLPEMGPPETTIWEFPGEDRSWHHEFEHFLSEIEGGLGLGGTINDALAALEVVEFLYRQQTVSAQAA